MTDPKGEPQLGMGRGDRIAIAARGGIGAIPVVGPIVAEIVGALIPDQRTDRIAAFLRELANRLEDLEADVIERKMKEPAHIDLFEDCATQAARALSSERHSQLASLFANALTTTHLSQLEYKHLVQLLGELNDVEILILRSHCLAGQERIDFMTRHETALMPRPPYLGAPATDHDRAAMHEAYKGHLRQLGLLAQRFRRPSGRGESVPEFDYDTGMVKANGESITRLGHLLIRVIDARLDKEE